MKKSRLEDIDRAKGLGILLVVIGHITLGEFPPGNEWYRWLNSLLYMFHMSFFMFLSGFVAHYSYRDVKSLHGYLAYQKKKFTRFVPAFLLFGVLICVGKSLMTGLLHIDNPPGKIFDSLLTLLIMPQHSASTHLWYIYVLFLYYLVVPLLAAAIDRFGIGILVSAFAACFLQVTEYCALNLAVRYLLSFTLGMWCAKNIDSYSLVLDRFKSIFLLVFAFVIAISPIFPESTLKGLIVGLASIPALHSLVRLSVFKADGILAELGRYSYPIYLMHTVAIGFAKGVVLKITSWDGARFLFIAPVLLLAGLCVPVTVMKYLIARIKFFNRIVGGMMPAK